MCNHISSNEALAENITPMATYSTYYLLTIRKSAVYSPVSQDEINNVYDFLSARLQSFKVILYNYEVDPKYDQLHSHAIISINQYFHFTSYNKFGEFFIHWKPIKDIKNSFKTINNYLHKQAWDKYKQEQILITNHYRHNYGFI